VGLGTTAAGQEQSEYDNDYQGLHRSTNSIFSRSNS
jgi:hypothetical protein